MQRYMTSTVLKALSAESVDLVPQCNVDKLSSPCEVSAFELVLHRVTLVQLWQPPLRCAVAPQQPKASKNMGSSTPALVVSELQYGLDASSSSCGRLLRILLHWCHKLELLPQFQQIKRLCIRLHAVLRDRPHVQHKQRWPPGDRDLSLAIPIQPAVGLCVEVHVSR